MNATHTLDKTLAQIAAVRTVIPGESAATCLAVLVLLADGPSIKMSATAQRVGLSRAAFTATMDRLEKAGIAQRKQDTGDRRKLGVSLTTDGANRLKAALANA